MRFFFVFFLFCFTHSLYNNNNDNILILLYKIVDDFPPILKYILRMSQGDVGCVSMLECTVNYEGGR